MAELLEGHLAPTGGEQPTAPAPFRLRDSGRVAPDPSHWAQPLPPLLWRRLDEQDRQRHERAVEAHAEAAAKARELTAKARQQAADDEAALREAIASGAKPPKAKAATIEAAADEARRAADMAARLVLESGRGLVERFDDDDVRDAVNEAQQRAAKIIETVPEQVDALLDELGQAAALGSEANWCGRLLERRLQGPWRASSQPLTHRLALVAQHAHEAKTYAAAEVEERGWRARGPVTHHAPASAPPAVG